jgi:hypothetical protein
MKSDTPTTPRGLGRSRQRACLSSDSSEKISNYLNIWRIAVSSDRALPYPLKPREMRACIRKDAAGCTKVITRARSKEATCRLSRNELQRVPWTAPRPPFENPSFLHSVRRESPLKLVARLLTPCLPALRVADRFFSPERRITPVGSHAKGLTDLVPAVFCCCKLLINK